MSESFSVCLFACLPAFESTFSFTGRTSFAFSSHLCAKSHSICRPTRLSVIQHPLSPSTTLKYFKLNASRLWEKEWVWWAFVVIDFYLSTLGSCAMGPSSIKKHWAEAMAWALSILSICLFVFVYLSNYTNTNVPFKKHSPGIVPGILKGFVMRQCPRFYDGSLVSCQRKWVG